MDRPEHHIIDSLKEGEAETGRGRRPTFPCRERFALNQISIETTLGPLLRDRVKRVMTFPSDTMQC